MAFADTQKLIVDLSLVGNFGRSLQGAERDLTRFNAAAVRAANSASPAFKIGAGIGLGIRNATTIAIAGLGALTSQIGFGLNSLSKLDSVVQQTNAVLKSTGQVAGETGDDIRALANKYEDLNATIDDKVIQSTENLLLTFTNVRKQAFEPTLQAILDMNTAMGGGEAGLKNVTIQVGKALQDPIRGLTALRRVGVAFTDDQQKQIEKLVKSNNLYGAQKIILAELTREFGGSFAAAGNTAAGTFAKLGDAVEDLQQNLATAALPAVLAFANGLNRLFRDPAVIQGAKDLGTNIAGLFTQQNIEGALRFARNVLPSIRSGLELTARVAKGAIDAFNSLPKELQAVAVAALVGNKLTGGLVASGVGDIAKGLGGALIGALTKAGVGKAFVQPVFVTNQALPGAGGTVGGGAGLLGTVKNFALFAGALGIAAVALDKFQNELAPLNQHIADQSATITAATNAYSLAQKSLADLQKASDGTAQGIAELDHPFYFLYGDQKKALEASKAAIEAEIAHRKALATDERAQAVDEARQHNDLSLAFDRLEGAASPMARAFHDVTAAARAARDAWRAAMKQELAILHGRLRIPTIAAGADTSANLLKLADVLVGKFERSRAPFYNDVKNERRAIEGLEKLQQRFLATGDRKSAAAIGRDIERMKRDLHGTTRDTANAIRRKRLSVTVPVSTVVNTYVSAVSVLKSYSTVSKYGTINLDRVP